MPVENLQITDIKKTYKKEGRKEQESVLFELASISLTIHEGEFFSLLGPSGCGKTTLLKLVAGLISPDSGGIYLNKKEITHLSPEKRDFSMVFQQSLLFPHMTVEENISFGLKMKGVKKAERIQQANDMLKKVGLEGYSLSHPSELSGGQQQRVSLARALVMEPRLLLMDEPFSALDPELREEMRGLIRNIQQSLKVTILFVTHDREEAFELSDRIGIMNGGSLLQVGTPEELYRTPNSPQVALFLGAKNVFRGSIDEERFFSGDFSVEAEGYKGRSEPGWLIMRPETIQPLLSKGAGELVDEQKIVHSLEGVVSQLSFRQGIYHMKVNVKSVIIEVIHQTMDSFPTQMGDEILLVYRPSHLYFIPDSLQSGH